VSNRAWGRRRARVRVLRELLSTLGDDLDTHGGQRGLRDLVASCERWAVVLLPLILSLEQMRRGETTVIVPKPADPDV
jgi:hypothetical protein